MRTLLIVAASVAVSLANQWKEWWTYEGFSGPDFWGLVNSEWKMCARGLQQSPINVDPSLLLYDPNLSNLYIDRSAIMGTLENTGQQLLIHLNSSLSKNYGLNVSGGPLGSYHFQLHHIVFHFPRTNIRGSEHTIDGERFPAEMQLLGFNRDLYANFTEAMTRPQGLVGIAVMIDVIDPQYSTDTSNVELKKITGALRNIRFKGSRTELKSLSMESLMPDLSHFITYEGSLTYPGCYETVSWVLLNKPIYLTKAHLNVWQNSLEKAGKGDAAAGLLGDNFRPLKDLNTRLLRTNINFRTKVASLSGFYPTPWNGEESFETGTTCPTMYKEMYYRSNPWRRGDAYINQQDQPDITFLYGFLVLDVLVTSLLTFSFEPTPLRRWSLYPYLVWKPLEMVLLGAWWAYLLTSVLKVEVSKTDSIGRLFTDQYAMRFRESTIFLLCILVVYVVTYAACCWVVYVWRGYYEALHRWSKEYGGVEELEPSGSSGKVRSQKPTAAVAPADQHSPQILKVHDSDDHLVESPPPLMERPPLPYIAKAVGTPSVATLGFGLNEPPIDPVARILRPKTPNMDLLKTVSATTNPHGRPLPTLNLPTDDRY